MCRAFLGRWALVCAMLVSALFAGAGAFAQDYPARTIQVIVPFAGGSASDVILRVLLDRMSRSLGQTFVVENRPGAGGNIGTLAGAKAAPDGYTLVMSSIGPLASNKTLVANLGYDPEADFAPISMFAYVPNIVVVSAKLPVNSLRELIDYAKARPKQLNYGSVGIGSSQHLAAVYFEQVVGIELTHVPYRNIAQYGPDLIAGAVPLGFQWLPNVSGPLQAGGAKALAVTSRERMPALPNVPTVVEAGVSGYEPSGWLGLLGPRGTPKPIVDKLHGALAAAIKEPEVRQRFAELGAEPTGTTPEEFAGLISSDIVKWRDIIARGGVSLESK